MAERYFVAGRIGPEFQIRLPADLAAKVGAQSLRAKLPHGGRRELRRQVVTFAGAANGLFNGLRQMSEAQLKTLNRNDLKALFDDRLRVVMDGSPASAHAFVGDTSSEPLRDLLLAANELLSKPSPKPGADARDQMASVSLLVKLRQAQDEGRYLVSADADAMLEKLVQRAVWARDNFSDVEAVFMPKARADVALPAPEPALAPQHLASMAFKHYADDLNKRKNDTGYADNLAIRARMFLALVGDIPLLQITNSVLRNFGYAISHLPAEVARRSSWHEGNLLQILRANGYRPPNDDDAASASKSIKHEPISAQTLENKTLRPIQTAFEQYAADKGLSLPLKRFTFSLPDHTPRAKSRGKPSSDHVARLIRADQEDGRLVQAMLPCLGALVGRRLSLLAFMRAETLCEVEDGVFTMSAERRYFANGEQKMTPIKNDASEYPFVLHRFLVDCGFVDFIKRKKSGWLFESLHVKGLQHPESAAQKRMAALRNVAGIEKTVFHQLRHFVIGSARNSLLPEDIRKRQVGQKGDTHAQYADA